MPGEVLAAAFASTLGSRAFSTAAVNSSGQTIRIHRDAYPHLLTPSDYSGMLTSSATTSTTTSAHRASITCHIQPCTDVLIFVTRYYANTYDLSSIQLQRHMLIILHIT